MIRFPEEIFFGDFCGYIIFRMFSECLFEYPSGMLYDIREVQIHLVLSGTFVQRFPHEISEFSIIKEIRR